MTQTKQNKKILKKKVEKRKMKKKKKTSYNLPTCDSTHVEHSQHDIQGLNTGSVNRSNNESEIPCSTDLWLNKAFNCSCAG